MISAVVFIFPDPSGNQSLTTPAAVDLRVLNTHNTTCFIADPAHVRLASRNYDQPGHSRSICPWDSGGG